MITSKKLNWVLLGLIGLACVAFIAIFYKGSASLQAKSDQLVDLKAQNDVAQAQLTSLQQAKIQVDKYGYFKDVAKTVIPNDKDQAQAIFDISNFASQAGFLIGGITFPSSDLGKNAAAPATAAKPVDATKASATDIISQAKPVPGIPGLYSVELTVTPQVDNSLPSRWQPNPSKLIEFLKKIESNRRTAQITQVDVQPQLDTSGKTFKTFSFSITINIFIRPGK